MLYPLTNKKAALDGAAVNYSFQLIFFHLAYHIFIF